MSRRIMSIALAAVLVGAFSQPIATADEGDGVTYSGRAIVVRADVAGQRTAVSDTGELQEEGGALEASQYQTGVPPALSAKVLHASTVGTKGETSSQASVADVSFTTNQTRITAGFVMSEAEAECTDDGDTDMDGSSQIAQLRVNGERKTVDSTPNQTIPLPNGRIVVNEQIEDDEYETFTVNALHIVVAGAIDVTISSTTAGVTDCPVEDAPTTACVADAADFVTGGGKIQTSNGKASFAVASGNSSGGHLNYRHKAENLRVKAGKVSEYSVVDATSRRITGAAKINKAEGTFDVVVSDQGKGKGTDTFSITLSNGYSASGTLRNGNIQLHKAQECV